MNKPAVIALSLSFITTVWTWWPQAETKDTVITEISQLLNHPGIVIEPEVVASIRVAKTDSVTKAPKVFEVRKQDGGWTIPSHFDYPADGGTQVGETAGAVINLPMGPLVTADKQAHSEYGLEDPLTSNGANAGTRVTLTNESGTILVDVIIGKAKPTTDVFFVRRANENQVYTAKVEPQKLKTTFQDWVETDPLKINESDIRRAAIRNYSIDESKALVKMRSVVDVKKPKDADEWKITPKKAGKGANETTVKTLVREVANLRLVGVRPYSPAWLQARGFYVNRGNNRLFGNEGELQLQTKDGLLYSLFFGEIALGDKSDKSPQLDQASFKETEKESSSHNRYMAIFVQYSPEDDETIPEAEYPEATTKKAKAKTKPTNHEAIDKALEEGSNRAQTAQARFEKFFYVISDDSFQKLRPSQNSLYSLPKLSKAN